MDQLELFTPARLPRRPLCTDRLSDGCWRERQELALTRTYIQIDPPGVSLWLAFDVDRPAGGLAWQEVNLPAPAWSATTRQNGHGHLVYGLSVPVVGRDLASRQVRFKEAVQEAFRERLGADEGFAGVLTKNPRHPSWLVERGLQRLWTLGELAEYVTLPKSPRLGEVPAGGFGRNVDTFDRLRFWAYGAVDRLRGEGFDAWQKAVTAKALHLDQLNTPALGWQELKHIVKSVAKWTWRNYVGGGGAFNVRASQLGKLGGRPKTTTAFGAPWTLAGVSRATWYRRHSANVGQAFGK